MNENIPENPDISPHELFSSYHDGLKEAVDFVQSKVIGVLRGQLSLCAKESAILGIFLRTHALASSLTRLNHKIDFNAVAGIARIMFELLLDIKLISGPMNDQINQDRFLAFPEVNRYRTASKIVDLQKKHPDLVNRSFFVSDIRKEFVDKPGKATAISTKVLTLWGKTKTGKPIWPKHWSGLHIRERAEKFGPTYEQEYLEIYSFLSSYTHAGSEAYAGLSEETLEGVYGMSLDYARYIYIESLVICSNVFDIEKGIESFNQVIKFLEDAPRNLLIKHCVKKIKGTNSKA